MPSGLHIPSAGRLVVGLMCLNVGGAMESKYVIKNLSDYQRLAGVTRKTDDPGKLEMIHYALGMVGEAMELSSVVPENGYEYMKELGDCFWYAASFCSVLGEDLEEVFRSYGNLGVINIMAPNVATFTLGVAARIAEGVKKAYFYDRPVEDFMFHVLLANYVGGLFLLCEGAGLVVEDVLRANIAKLEARYGGKFDAAKAINRDLLREDEGVKNA